MKKKLELETYYQKNKEKRVAYAREWQANHPEKVKEYRRKHAPKQKEYYKKWYKKTGRPRAVGYCQENNLEYQQEHPDRIKTQRQLYYQIKSGHIKRPENCPRCGKKSRLHAHHINYNHFMNFVWLCTSCHKNEHLTAEKT